MNISSEVPVPATWERISPKDLNPIWEALIDKLQSQFRARLKAEAILLLIGMREMGYSFREYSKQEKMDLMHVGTCTVLAPSGFYLKEQTDSEGWPHWSLVKPLPYLDIFAQAHFLRYHILKYFQSVYEDLPRWTEG